MTIYEYMEDYDNSEIQDREEWEAVMIDAIEEYYDLYPDIQRMKTKNVISNYKSWKRDKNPLLNENWDE